MSKKQSISEDTLLKMGLHRNADGSYSKAKTILQPREKVIPVASNKLRKVSFTLFGEPMAKQSVRSTKSGHFFQPKKYVDKEKDYRNQIAKQLPKDFQIFTEEARITKLHFIYAPLKAFHKIKGRMEQIREGKLFPKTTRPDVCDNLKKLVLDSMSELVYSDDSIIWGEDNVRKFFGTGGCVIIEIEGK
jgi:Holliday junction resolvase RusA-like endonuclease